MMISEEEVRENKKKLMMELEWTSAYNSTFRESREDKKMMTLPYIRSYRIRKIESLTYLRLSADDVLSGKYKNLLRIKSCNEFVASLPPTRVEKVALKRETMVGRCLALFGIYFTYEFENQVRVNLKTRELVMYEFY